MRWAGQIDGHPEAALPPERLPVLIDNLHRAGELARSRGFDAVLHFHAGSYVETFDEIRRVMDRLDPALVGMCLDTGHARFGGADPTALLAELLGGTPFLGFISAVAFATILAVVAGLTLSGAAALSHDLWVSVVRKGHADSREQLFVARVSTITLGVLAIALGITFKGQNVAFMVSLAFAIAASANFPALLLSIFWRRCTTAGAVASMAVGTLSTLLLIWLSPTVQVDILKAGSAWFPLKNPALVTIPLSFLTAFVVSLLGTEAESVARFAEVERRTHLGPVGE